MEDVRLMVDPSTSEVLRVGCIRNGHLNSIDDRPGFAIITPETTLKNRRNPASPRNNTCQPLGFILPCNKVLMVDPVDS